MRFITPMLYLNNAMGHQKKSFIIHLRKKRFTQKIIIMSCQQMFFAVKRKENDLDRKYRLLGGPAENASSPTISQIEQN